MRYTVSYFRPEEHCPEPFLCQKVVLPELEGFSPRLRQILENPILSPDQVDDWCEAMEWFSNGYDEKLAPNHWGGFTARTLEALFWRVVDMAQDNPRWPRGISLPLVNEITVYCDTMSLHHLSRDLMVLFSQTTPEEKTDGLEIRYPDIKTDRFFLNDQEE